MKTIAFSGSNSKNSINQQLVTYAGSLVNDTEVINLSNYELPIYSIDIENVGMPENVKLLDQKLATTDQLIISVSEHNGNISAFFKNALDWLSRNNREFLKGKKVVVLSTSPGKGGANTALHITESTLPYFGANVVAIMSVPSFNANFENGKLINSDLNKTLNQALNKLD